MANTSETRPVVLSKLTVPQLKALCKERRITGYSKLGKSALLQKLTDCSDKSKDSPLAPVPPTAVVKKTVGSTTLVPSSTEARKTGRISLPSSHISPGAAFSSPKDSNNKDTLEPSVVDNACTGLVVPGAVVDRSPIVITPRNVGGEQNLSSNVAISPQEIIRPSKASIFNSEGDDTSTSKGSKRLRTENSKIADDTILKRARLPVTANPKAPGGHAKHHVSSTPVIRSLLTVSAKLPSFLDRTKEPIPAPVNSVQASGANYLELPNVLLSKGVTDLSSTKRKRFKPLVVSRGTYPRSGVQRSSNTSPRNQEGTRPDLTSLDSCSHPTGQHYLNFSPSPPVSLANITLPPKLSDRKRVHVWAISLSGASNNDRKSCSLVSRMFRYAVYLSAAHILAQNYPGSRLDEVTKRYPQNMTNMWPYLRQRETEELARRQGYGQSYVGRYFQGFSPLSERLWANPDHEQQTVIALRFIATRLWFTLSIGGAGQDPLEWTKSVVEDVQQVVEGEIWSVTIKERQSDITKPTPITLFYVLESTCEVIGCPLPQSHSASSSSTSPYNLRADWSAYISRRLSTTSEPERSVINHLKWANCEEFDRGVSKLWLKRIAGEGDEGRVKREVAERYIMASVVSNSVSGEWMSTNQMAQEFSGIPSRGNEVKTCSPRINLYLPLHHHVESVHFTHADGRTLHPALAVVQTPGREYYILKDNGMQVGCEEDGVADVWMQVLGCSNRGLEDKRMP